MFTIDRKRLAEAVARVTPAAGTRTGPGYSLPALQAVLFSHSAHGQLRLEATNGEQRAETNLFTEKGEAFERLADAKSVTDALRAQKHTFVEVAPDGPGLRIGDVTVPGMKLDEWVKQPAPGQPIGQLRAQSFHLVLARVVLAMSKDDARPTLNGIAVVPDEGVGMRLRATNSYWLAQVDVPHARLGGENTLMLPARAVAILLKLLKGEKGTVALRLTHEKHRRYLWFRHPTWTFCTLVSDVQFPDFDALIGDPDDGEALVVNIPELREIVDEARKLKAERMEINLNGEIEVSAIGPTAAMHRSLRGAPFAGELTELVLSPEYLQGCLTVVPDPAVRVRGTAEAPLKPICFYAKGEVALLMPIRLPTPVPEPDPTPPVRYEQSPNDPYMHPVESDGDAEEDALDEVVGIDPDELPDDDTTVTVDDADPDEEYTYIGRHAFRALGWDPDVSADTWECATCEEVVTWVEVESTHRCWKPQDIT